MADLSELISQVNRNCNISDAKYWGNYTVCSLLLQLREQYKFENDIKPWEDVRKEAILSWISEREKLWAELEDKEFIQIVAGDKEYSAFESDSINEKLLPSNILYGAGYGQRMKPSFFLAELQKSDIIKGCRLYIAGREYARDMAAYPAMLQGKKIIVRRDVILLTLWDKFNEMRSNKYKSSLAFAFKFYGVSPDEEPSEGLNARLIEILGSEIESYIHHEIGEMSEGERLGEQWKIFFSSVFNSKIEILARSIKDILADTSENGLLRHIIEIKNEGSLAFYVSSLRGYRKVLFKEISDYFGKFIETKDWDEIEKIRADCYRKIADYAKRMMKLSEQDPERTRLIENIEKDLSHLL